MQRVFVRSSTQNPLAGGGVTESQLSDTPTRNIVNTLFEKLRTVGNRIYEAFVSSSEVLTQSSLQGITPQGMRIEVVDQDAYLYRRPVN